MTSIAVADGTSLPVYVARPAFARAFAGAFEGAPTGVIVAHELFGVNPDIRGVADDLAAAGYLAIAPDFYHRDAPPGRWLERDDAGRQEGFGYGPDRGDRLQRGRPPGLPGRLPVSRTAVLYGGWLPGTDIPLSQP